MTNMTPERYQKICDIFARAQEMPREKRGQFLDAVCLDDRELRDEVESLLASDENSGDFIESPALELAAEMVAAEETARQGRSIAQYTILTMIGVGGMGEVWLAEDTKLKRRVALKLISGVQAQDRLARFEQEAYAVSALNHPNIITIYDIGASEGTQFIATEYIEGKTLRQMLKEQFLTPFQAVEIAVQICAALCAAHAAGIIHRDIKPENIMIRSDGLVKVLDFGLARFNEKKASDAGAKNITKPGMIMGTVTYMSPEQARALTVDEKTDVFSLGIVLYEMLAGHSPFEGTNEIEILAAILERQPAPLDAQIPAALKNIVDKALSKFPFERWSAVELLNELRQIKRELEFSAEFGKFQTQDNGHDEKTMEMTAVTGDNRHRGTRAFVSPTDSPRASFFSRVSAAVAVCLLVVTGLFLYFQYFGGKQRAAVLSESDKILLAEFENKTGDTDFDGTLRQPLAVGLSQSPFLSLVADGQIRQTLKEMEKPPDEPLTIETAREICQRRAVKAFLKSTIENYGVEYRITLEAFKTETGESVALESTQAKNKEEVLAALSEATEKMRENLGESLASIEKYDTPIQNATTGSFEALRIFTLANKSLSEGKNDEAILLFKRAVELDPNFAAAYAALGITFYNKQQFTTAAEYAEKAFNLRDRTTEREKLRIADFYYAAVTGEADKSIEILELFKQTYPREFVTPHNLGATYMQIGKFAKAEENARLAISIDPTPFVTYSNLGRYLNRQSRFEEAKAVFEDLQKREFNSPQINEGLFVAAFARGDEAEMQKQIEELKKKEETDRALVLQANPAIFGGRFAEYAKILTQAIGVAEKEAPEVAADYAGQTAVYAAALGKCSEAKNWSDRALKYDREKAILTDTAFALTLCGGDASALITELKERYPKNTVVNSIWLPLIRAAQESETSPDRALETLEINRQFEGGSYFWDNYLRGKIYSKLKKADSASAEFKKILDNRGWSVQSPLYALAHLELARVYAMQSDRENVTKHLEEFKKLWRNADGNLAALNDAKTLGGN